VDLVSKREHTAPFAGLQPLPPAALFTLGGAERSALWAHARRIETEEFSVIDLMRSWAELWRDWTGDRRLLQAIHAELRRGGYAVNAARIRDVRLAAIERPGWVQVYRFGVETSTNPENPHERRSVVLLGLSRDDGRKSRIEVLLTEDEVVWRERWDAWSDGLVRRR